MEVDDHRTPEWTCSEVLQLIKEYGSRPALWDPDCEDYKNRFRKHHIWLELAAIFKCSKLEVERKMKILNSQYRRERLKAVRMRKMGKTHRVTWYGYKAFGFMNKLWVRYKNRSNLTGDVDEIKVENDDQEGGFSAAMTQIAPFLNDEEELREEDDSEKLMFLEKEGFDKEEAVQAHKDGVIKVLCDNKDEWTLFGELIAHAFRKLPDDRTRCIVKHKINTILYEAELASYGVSCNKADN